MSGSTVVAAIDKAPASVLGPFYTPAVVFCLAFAIHKSQDPSFRSAATQEIRMNPIAQTFVTLSFALLEGGQHEPA